MSDVVSEMTHTCAAPVIDSGGQTDGGGPRRGGGRRQRQRTRLRTRRRAAATAAAAAAQAAQAPSSAPGDQLPRTGSPTNNMALAALMTILAGLALVFFSRTSERRYTPLHATTDLLATTTYWSSTLKDLVTDARPPCGVKRPEPPRTPPCGQSAHRTPLTTKGLDEPRFFPDSPWYDDVPSTARVTPPSVQPTR